MDKMKVAEWLFDYRTQVKRNHPLWSTAFRVKTEGPNTTGYSLDISRGFETIHAKDTAEANEKQLALALS
jgi:hypothetical protein